MNVFSKIFFSLVAANSIVLGWTYVMLAFLCGFAHSLGILEGNVLRAEWNRRHPWHAWLRFGALCGTWLALTAVFKLWWAFSLVALFTVVATLFVALASSSYTLCVGHGAIFSYYATEATVRHELFHVKQYEDLCLAGAIIGAFLLGFGQPWTLALAIWAPSGAPWVLPSYLAGILRYWRKGVDFMDAAYYGAIHEQSAYAVTDGYSPFRS